MLYKTCRIILALFVMIPLLPLHSAEAKTVSMTTNGAPLSFNIPDDWHSSGISQGLEIKSPDDEIFLWVEAYNDPELDSIEQEHTKYFIEQGIVINGEPKIESQDFDHYGLASLHFSAQWNNKPTVLRYLMIVPKEAAASRLILSYWASPIADKAYDGAVGSLIDSLATAIDSRH